MNNALVRWADLVALEDTSSNIPLFLKYASDEDDLVSSTAKEKLRRIEGYKDPIKSKKITSEVGSGSLSWEGFDGSLLSFLVRVDAYISGRYTFQPPRLEIRRPPQADDFGRILELVQGHLTDSEPFDGTFGSWELSDRQLSYYRDAAIQLGLLSNKSSSENSNFSPTLFARDIFESSGIEKIVRTVAVFAREQTFLSLLRTTVEFGASEDTQKFVEHFRKMLEGYELAESTRNRRLQTLEAWGKWLVDVIQNLQNVAMEREGFKVETTRQVLSLATYRAKLAKAEAQVLDRYIDPFIDMSKFTLEAIGIDLSVSRERVRQLEAKQLSMANSFFREDREETFDAVRNDLENRQVVNAFALAYSSGHTTRDTIWAAQFLLNSHGFETSSACYPIYYQPSTLEDFISDVSKHLPMKLRDVSSIANGLIVGPACLIRLSERTSDPLAACGELLVRRKSLRGDLVKWFLAQNGPSSIGDLLDSLGEKNQPALVEFLRRLPGVSFDAYAQTWELGNENPRGERISVFDAIVEVLEEKGALTINEIEAELRDRHRAGKTRIIQGLDDLRIGRMTDGRVGLIKNGAVRPEISEPKKGQNIISEGNIVELLLSADENQLRGSGFGVSSWIGWKLGLKSTPETARFEIKNGSGSPLLFTRRGGLIACSTIRNSLDELEIRLGCHFKISLDLETSTWSLAHLCNSH